jgi:tRNA threonylcarbamoyladenosine biosynthesis protein TsaB
MAGHRALSDAPLVLAVESATERASVALLEGETLLLEREGAAGAHHSETLLPTIDAVLRAAEVDTARLAGLAISIGPGSFTCLRVGLATVKGLCFGTGLRAVAVPTLGALAEAARSAGVAGPGDVVVPVLDARRGEVYGAGYRLGEEPSSPAREILPPGVFTAGGLAEALPGGGRLVGDGIAVVGAELARRGRFDAEAGAGVLPSAASVGRLAAPVLVAGRGVDPADLVPRYVRRAEAEVQRTARRFE